MIYTQPATFINWLTLIIIAASLSLIIGAVFWDVPNSDPQLHLNDRLGYHISTMCLMAWPLLLMLSVSEVKRSRRTVERDIKDGLYGRLTYIIAQSIINLPPSLFVWLIYLVPSYSMSGLYMQSLNDYDGFYIYVGVMLLYLICMQKFLLAFVYLIPSKSLGVTLCAVVSSVFTVSCGFLVHYKDLPGFVKFLDYINPSTWTLPFLISRELSPEAIASSSALMYCRNKQVKK